MPKLPRKPIPRVTELEILDKSRRRCALCFWILGDLEEKHGQIAHLDDDPSNGAEENLAFLCLSHHSVYDSTTRQHKNYRIEEVKAARSQLQTAIAEGKHIGAAGSASRSNADKATLSDLLELLPSAGVIQILRVVDFGGRFNLDELAPITQFIYERNGPEHEFLDPELEELRKKLRASCVRLKLELGVNSFPFNQPGLSRFSSIPSEWQHEKRKPIVNSLNSGADAICEAHEHLIRAARQKLNL